MQLLQSIARFLVYFKYPALALILFSLVIMGIVLFKPGMLNGKEYLFPAMVSLAWGCLFLLFPALFNNLPDFSTKPSGFVLRIKRIFNLIGYYFFAFVFLAIGMALILLTYKMLIVSF